MKKIFSILLISIMTFSLFSEIKLTASKAEYFQEILDNTIKTENLNIYPVKLFINCTCSNYDSIAILISEDGKSYSKVQTIDTTDSSITFFHNNTKAKAYQKYCYKVQTLKNSKVIEESSVENGWGALSPEFYFMAYNKIITYSHNKMILMNKKKNLEKLGEEVTKGDISGTLSYKTAVKGFNGLVTMNYDNYSDFSDWLIKGNMDTKANMNANGTMTGTVRVDGMYPGIVVYDNVFIVDGKAGNGTYDVQPDGYKLTQLDYMVTYKNIDDYL